MADSQVVAKKALKKLEDQLTCAVCLDAFKHPKLLQCFHVFCKNCLQRLVVQDKQGQLSILCPTCRHSTILPPMATDVSGLQSAFHIHHLFEIQEALEKLKEPEKVKCGRCKTPRPATGYCRDCGQFICDFCSTAHREWDAFTKHEVVAMGQLESKANQLEALKKVTLFCSLHEGKELELYCETCGELICHNCTISKHCRPEHKYELVADTFERHKSNITASLDQIDKQIDMLRKAVERLEVQLEEINDQGAAIEDRISQQMEEFHTLIETKKAEMFGTLHQLINVKVKNMAAQKDELETALARRSNCQSFVRDSLKRGSQGEVMKMKSTVTKQIKEITHSFKPDMLTPCEVANLKFLPSPELTQASQLLQFGKVFLQQMCPEKCYAEGKGLEVAKCGERATAVLHLVDECEKACSTPMETVSCELVAVPKKIDCSVKKEGDSQYAISYQTSSPGKYQLHVKVEGEHIKGSPFPVHVTRKFGNSDTIMGCKETGEPRGVAINSSGKPILVDAGNCCCRFVNVVVDGETSEEFGSRGSEEGQFQYPRGVTVDDDDNILVADCENNRIQKFTSDGKFITAVGRKGNKPLEFDGPVGIAVHPLNKKVYITEAGNHRLQILNADLTFSSCFGSKGSENGEFDCPWGVAFDSTGNVYVADCENHRIQVFTPKGEFLRKFGRKGEGDGEMNSPSGICIDSDDVVYVTELRCNESNNRVSLFSSTGRFLTTVVSPDFLDLPSGIAVDKNGVLYVIDDETLKIFF